MINLNEKTPRALQDGDSFVAYNTNEPNDVSLVQTDDIVTYEDLGNILLRIEALEKNALQFDSDNNVTLRDGSKILARTQTNAIDSEVPTYISRELIGMNKYTKDGQGNPLDTNLYPLGFFYASELGNMHVGTTLNTADRVAVDTEHGREYVQYASNGGKSVQEFDLSWDGTTPRTVNVTLGDLNILATRLNDTEVGMTVNSPGNISLPITRRASGPSVTDEWRKTIVSTSIGTILDRVNIATYKTVEYWVKYAGVRYYIVAGSDEIGENDYTLQNAWVEIYEGFVVSEPN